MTEEVVLSPIESYEGETLRWIQPSVGRRYFELVGPVGCYATLRWKGVLTELITGRTVGGSYSFKPGGFVHPHVIIKKDPYDEEIGRMRMRLAGDCDLEMADGGRFFFKHKGLWNTSWSFSLEDGVRLCTYTVSSTLLRRQANVLLEPEAKRVHDMAILLVLGWCQINLEMDYAWASFSAGALAPI